MGPNHLVAGLAGDIAGEQALGALADTIAVGVPALLGSAHRASRGASRRALRAGSISGVGKECPPSVSRSY